MNEREVLIARADKYLNTGSGEYASEIMRDMAEFIRRTPQIARVAQGVSHCGELAKALTRARVAIASLDKMALGAASVEHTDGSGWAYDYPLRDELLAEIDAALASPAQSSWQPSEQEQHAIGHARYQVERATPEFPEVCFDYELILTLLKIIDRTSPVPSTDGGTAA